MVSFKKCNCSRKNRLQSLICFANVGCSPTPRQHFWKTAAPKNFLFACGLDIAAHFYFAFMSYNVSRETLLLGIPPESSSARLGHIPSLPWESQLPLKSCISLQPFDWKGNCDSLWFSLRFLLHFHCAVRFASQMWAARPCLGSIFEKLLHRKTFCLPAAWILQPISILLLCHIMFHVKHCF